MERVTVSQELKPLKNEGTHQQKWGRSLKILSSIKEVGKLKKIVRIKFFRILEISQRLAAIREAFTQEIS